MNAPKVGDRVRVEFEGTVQAWSSISGLCTIRYEDADNIYSFESVPDEICKVLAPPIKVGDVVTADNVGQLPDWSIVCPDGEDWNPYQKRGGIWFEMCETEVVEVDISDAIDAMVHRLRVLRIGVSS